jgi:hypothetical protein
MKAIEILGLEKTYNVGFWRKRLKRALHPLHLQIEEGEISGAERCWQDYNSQAVNGINFAHGWDRTHFAETFR